MARKRKGDWVPARAYGAPLTLDQAAPSTDLVLVRTTTDEDPAQPGTGVVEAGSEVLVQRVVGQVRASMEEGSATLAMRIRVGIYDDQLDQAAFFATSLFDAGDANEPFLWQRYVRMTGGTDLFDYLSHPWWNSVDVRVARRLTRDQALYISFQAFGLGATDAIVLNVFLRSWARALM